MTDRPPIRQARTWMLGLLAALAACLSLPGAALADHTQQSVFQDDQYLLYEPFNVVYGTLAELRQLGVQQIRVTVKWSTVAPNPDSRHRPGSYYFNEILPSSYPAANWVPYDRVVELAHQLGIAVQLNLTGPGPLWAMGAHSPTTRAADHWYPNAGDFQAFTYAVGLRYSGHYFGLPRVNMWSIWNEPNQPGWLSPQSLRIKGRVTAVSPRLYRSYVRAAYSALYFSGHAPATDTVLIGELAPEGYETSGFYTAMTPLPFLRDLYCVSAGYRPLSGSAATALGCPKNGSRSQFVKDNPGLFQASGFAHHPYYFFHPPSFSAPDPNFAPIANTGRLERALDRSVRAWGSRRQFPIYFTEYGYQTRPPDPYQVVTTAQQAEYLNDADYMAWRDRRVRSVGQFLLFDSAPDPRFTKHEFGYWDTFQTGLLFQNGKPKPSFGAYRIPIWVPSPSFRRGSPVFVWGQIRPASAGARTTALVQWRAGGRGSFTTLAKIVTKHTDGYLTARVRPPGTGFIRIAWSSRHGRLSSRTVSVTAR
jgi:hypothetical protein